MIAASDICFGIYCLPDKIIKMNQKTFRRSWWYFYYR